MENSEENIGFKREKFEKERDELNTVLRRSITAGRRPKIEAGLKLKYEELVREVVCNEDNTFISVIPSNRENLITQITDSLNIIVSELKRNNLEFNDVFPESSVREQIEIMICEYEMFRYINAFGNTRNKDGKNEYGFKKSVFNDSQLQKLTAYHTSQFILRLLNDDKFIAKELGITEQEATEIFTRSIRFYFAINNISNPIFALRRVKKNLDNVLTDENIAEELGITKEEAADIFTRSTRFHFAVNNIADPISALRRVKGYLDNTLTDENIAKELGITEQEATEIFTRSIRFYFAVGNISNPISALKRVKENLDSILTDENIAEEFGISKEEAADIFTRSIRFYFAVGNILDPIRGIFVWLNGGSKIPFSLPPKYIIEKINKHINGK